MIQYFWPPQATGGGGSASSVQIQGYGGDSEQNSLANVTVQPSAGSRRAIDAHVRGGAVINTSTAQSGSTTRVINCLNTQIIPGDIIRWLDFTANRLIEEHVESVISGTSFTLAQGLPVAPVGGENFAILRPITEQLDTTGKQVVTLDPPTGGFSTADRQGDTTETAPATDTAASGQNGRLQRIAQRLTSLIALFPASLGQKTMSNSLAVALASDQSSIPVSGPLTDTQLRASAVPISAAALPLPAGAATSAAQTTTNSSLSSIDSKIPALVSGKQPVVVSNTDSSIIVTGSSAVGAAPTFNPVSVSGVDGGGLKRHLLTDSSGRMEINTVQSLPLPSGAATSANQSSELTLIGAVTETAPASDTASSGLNGRLQRIAQRITSLIALLPSALGQSTMANSLAVVLASNQSAIPVTASVTDATASGNITTQNLNPTTGAATAGSTVALALSGNGTVTVQVTGTYTGALTAQGTVDGSTWVALSSIMNVNTGLNLATITSALQGIFQLEVSGLAQVRITALAAVTGTAVVSLRGTNTTGLMGLDAPLPAGSAIIGALTANQSVNVSQMNAVAVLMGTGATGTGSQRTTPASVAGTITQAQITVGVAAVRATVAGTAPNAARVKLMINPSPANTGRIWIGASTVTTTTGMEIIGPDRLVFDFDAGDYYLISDTAAQSVGVVEKV